jgi:hypothetical protein
VRGSERSRLVLLSIEGIYVTLRSWQAKAPATVFLFSVFLTIGGPQPHGYSVEDVGFHRGARTSACRVRTLANTFLTKSERSQKCERGT